MTIENPMDDMSFEEIHASLYFARKELGDLKESVNDERFSENVRAFFKKRIEKLPVEIRILEKKLEEMK